MKKMFGFFIIATALFSNSTAQNVGVGTTMPAEKLDVNGNLNVQGNIKINGAAGQEGQVLMTSNTGATIWAKSAELKNTKAYVASGTFTVPAGVTELFVEVWSGGGGGAVGGGGGGGGYASGFLKVGAATSATVTVGAGGAGAATSVSIGGAGTVGGNSQISINAQTITVIGGSGGGTFYGGDGGRVFTSPSADFVFVEGEVGHPTSETYFQRTSTQYVTAVNYGNGGDAAMLPGTGSIGAFKSYDTNTPATTIKFYESTGASKPGGGGGGGPFGSAFGSPGAGGMVVIRW